MHSNPRAPLTPASPRHPRIASRRSLQRRSRRLAVLGLISIAGCTDVVAPTAQPRQLPGPPSPSTFSQASIDSLFSQASIDSLTRAVASALVDGTVRGALRDEMRDSPRPEHTVPVAQYLKSEAGLPLARAVANKLGMTSQAFDTYLQRFGSFVVWMERPLDRARWEATPDVVVYGSR